MAPQELQAPFPGAKGFNTKGKEGACPTHWSAKEKEQREMVLGVGAEGTRGWRLDAKKWPSVHSQQPHPVGVRRPPLSLAPTPAPELPAAA